MATRNEDASAEQAYAKAAAGEPVAAPAKAAAAPVAAEKPVAAAKTAAPVASAKPAPVKAAAAAKPDVATAKPASCGACIGCTLHFPQQECTAKPPRNARSIGFRVKPTYR